MNTNLGSKLNVFISLPMSGRKDEEIREDIQKAKEWFIRSYIDKNGKRYSEDEVYFYNNLDGGYKAVEFEKKLTENDGSDLILPPEDKMGLWYLGVALNNMAYCDKVLFWGEWNKSRGCQIEYQACLKYGISSIIPLSVEEGGEKRIIGTCEDELCVFNEDHA